jgi:hypothetical protein
VGMCFVLTSTERLGIAMVDFCGSVDALAWWRVGLRSEEDDPVGVVPHRTDRAALVEDVVAEIWISRQASFIKISKLDSRDRGRVSVEAVAEAAVSE